MTIGLVTLIIFIIWGPPKVVAHGAVATDVPECSRIGLDVLKEGGSAVDAAIAALFCLQVLNPQASGIGGGGFALIYDHKNKDKYYVDFTETAPAAFKPEMMDQLSENPALAVGVPGQLRGLHDIHSKYGDLEWSRLLTPAIDLARKGFGTSKALYQDIERFDRIKDLPTSKRLEQYLYPNGTQLTLNPCCPVTSRGNFVDTLQRIWSSGVEEFYTGKLGQEIVDELKSMGGILTMEDLASYKAAAREPLSTTYNNFEVLTGPPPSSGAAMLLVLNVLEGFNMTANDSSTVTYWHRMIEALKFESAGRIRLGDPRFEMDVDNIVKEIIDKSYAKELRMLVRDDGFATHSKYPSNTTTDQPEAKGWTHLAVLDSDDLYVSISASVNNVFGGGIMTSHGIILNDAMRSFASNSEDLNNANRALAGKRPRSCMTPTVVFDPEDNSGLRMSTGGSNGLLGVLMNVMAFNQNAIRAVENPRVFACELQNAVYVEGANLHAESPGILRKLRSNYGHNIVELTDNPLRDGVQVVMKRNNTITAYSDYRTFGSAVTY